MNAQSERHQTPEGLGRWTMGLETHSRLFPQDNLDGTFAGALPSPITLSARKMTPLRYA